MMVASVAIIDRERSACQRRHLREEGEDAPEGARVQRIKIPRCARDDEG